MKQLLVSGMVAALIAAVVAVPVATGGPNPLSVAKKALRTAKKANRKAATALGVANEPVIITRVEGPTAFQCGPSGSGGCAVDVSRATCPTGTYATGGGYQSGAPNNVVSYAKAGSSTYAVIAVNDNEFFSNSIKAQAICASGPVAAAAAAGRPTNSQLRAEIKREVASMRASIRAAAP